MLVRINEQYERKMQFMDKNKNKSPLELIGERVQLKRKELGLTQEQFADKYGYPRTTLAKLEAGLRDFKSTELLILAEQLGVSCDYLLGRTRTAAADNLTQAAVERYGLPEEALSELCVIPISGEGFGAEHTQAMSCQADTMTYRAMVTLLLTTELGKNALEKLASYYFGEPNEQQDITAFFIPWDMDSGTFIKSSMFSEELQRETLLELAKADLKELRTERTTKSL